MNYPKTVKLKQETANLLKKAKAEFYKIAIIKDIKTTDNNVINFALKKYLKYKK